MPETQRQAFERFFQSVLTGLKELDKQFNSLPAERQLEAIRFVSQMDLEVWGYLPE